MTNAEKYKEVFGMPVDPDMCPSEDCDICPCKRPHKDCFTITKRWWNEEYKENKE